jgi:hypothetical protein
MTAQTAQKLLNIVHSLEIMIAELGTKQQLLKSKIQKCKNVADEEIIKDATLALGDEMDSINSTITLVEDLHEHLQCA